MRLNLNKSLAVLALCLSVAACVPSQTMIDAGLAKPPEPQLVEGAYTTRSDDHFTVPAVPVEKIPQEFQRQIIYYETDLTPGTIIINPAAKLLYLITGRNQAMRYGISVGKAGFQWSGEAIIDHRKAWPTWTPPPEMIERKPELEKWKDGQPGGPQNPLGARALYLTTNGRDYGYRIHGTPEWFSIGHSASSGCIRMIHQDVMDLYDRVPDGARVIVLTASGEMPKGLTLPPPQPKKEKPKPPPVLVPQIQILPPPVLTPAILTAPVPSIPEPAAPQPETTVLCEVALVNGVCPTKTTP